MKNSFTAWRIFTLLFTSLFYSAAATSDTRNHLDSYYEQVKKEVFKDPYPFLPQYEVSRDLFDKNNENLLLKHATRTLSSNADFIELESKQKLLQANGICFAGTWRIAKDSPYSGLYASNTNIPVIARASVSLSGTKQNDKRAFGMAIKLFPGALEDGVSTQNIFVMHSLGGTKTKHILSLSMTNEPELGELPPFSQLLTAYRLESDLEQADKTFSKEKANARFRPVSQLGKVEVNTTEKRSQKIASNAFHAPHWLKIAPSSDTVFVDRDDFREELNVSLYPNNEITWDIFAAEKNKNGVASALWQPIGTLTVSESVVSLTCDTRLHFTHPAIP